MNVSFRHAGKQQVDLNKNLFCRHWRKHVSSLCQRWCFYSAADANILRAPRVVA